MSFQFPEELKNEVRERTDIVALISESVQLRRTGTNYIGLCPFHKEKSPSFNVNPARKIFKCFGCNEGGDVFQFLMKKENMSFPAALEKLAVAAGIDLSRYEKSSGGDLRLARLYEVNTAVQTYFLSRLTSQSPGLAYLEKRGINAATRREFGLGFAPESWTQTSEHLRSKGFTDEEMLTAGLVRKGQQSGVYDYFRNRVTFPIQDEKGRIVAFGGRILSDEKPKYLNSPETLIYSKGRLLYNYHRTGLKPPKDASDPLGSVILVEGYMDVVGLAQGGVRNVVATLGTALTEPQIRKLSRVAQTLYLAYDADEAGIRATLRSLELLESSRLSVKVLRLPDGVDPDELVIQQGPQAWEKVVKNAIEIEDYLFDHVVTPFNLEDLGQRREALRELQRVFAYLPDPTSKSRFLRRVSDRLTLAEEIVRSTFGTARTGAVSDEVLDRRPVKENLTPAARRERYLLAIFLLDTDLYTRWHEHLNPDEMEDQQSLRALQLLAGHPSGVGSLQDWLLGQAPDDEFRRFIAGLTVNFDLPEGDRDAAIQESLRLLRRDRLMRRREQIALQLRSCVDPAQKVALAQELNQVLREASQC